MAGCPMKWPNRCPAGSGPHGPVVVAHLSPCTEGEAEAARSTHGEHHPTAVEFAGQQAPIVRAAPGRWVEHATEGRIAGHAAGRRHLVPVAKAAGGDRGKVKGAQTQVTVGQSPVGSPVLEQLPPPDPPGPPGPPGSGQVHPVAPPMLQSTLSAPPTDKVPEYRVAPPKYFSV